MKIRAAVLERFGEPLVVQEVELAAPRAGEVLVRLHACGVCHTDMYTASGVDPSGYAPCVLGHEGAGVVEAVGEGVTSLAPGDHVVTLFSPLLSMISIFSPPGVSSKRTKCPLRDLIKRRLFSPSELASGGLSLAFHSAPTI